MRFPAAENWEEEEEEFCFRNVACLFLYIFKRGGGDFQLVIGDISRMWQCQKVYSCIIIDYIGRTILCTYTCRKLPKNSAGSARKPVGNICFQRHQFTPQGFIRYIVYSPGYIITHTHKWFNLITSSIVYPTTAHTTQNNGVWVW